MVEIIVAKQNKEKRIKEMRTISEISGTTLNVSVFKYRGPTRIKQKAKQKKRL